MAAAIIIGHGPSLVGAGCGAFIDEHPVVRMKDPHWQKREDYGKRTDAMVSSTEIMMSMLDWQQVPKEYWAQPKKGRWAAETESRFRARAKAPLRIPLEKFCEWNSVFRSLTEREVPNFSTGMAAIIFTLEYGRGLFDFDEIVLAGFDTLCNPDIPYEKAMKGKWATGHDWLAEHRMITRVIDVYGVPIRRLNAKKKAVEPVSWQREVVWDTAMQS